MQWEANVWAQNLGHNYCICFLQLLSEFFEGEHEGEQNIWLFNISGLPTNFPINIGVRIVSCFWWWVYYWGCQTHKSALLDDRFDSIERDFIDKLSR